MPFLFIRHFQGSKLIYLPLGSKQEESLTAVYLFVDVMYCERCAFPVLFTLPSVVLRVHSSPFVLQCDFYRLQSGERTSTGWFGLMWLYSMILERFYVGHTFGSSNAYLRTCDIQKQCLFTSPD